MFVDNCDMVDELNECVTDYLKFCEDLVCEKREIIC